MPWLQLTLLIDREQADAVEEALAGFGALAVTIDDGADDPLADPLLEPGPGETPLWRRLHLTALFDDDPAGRMQAEDAAQALGAQTLAAPTLTRLEDRPWERVWLDDFAPRRFGRRLWVCPHGMAPDQMGTGQMGTGSADDTVVVELDPGLAFGTGHHPTTALCLRWLDAVASVGPGESAGGGHAATDGAAGLAGRRVIDFGCGSGILAIAALKLGAAAAIAIDHDPQAIEATAENAERNGVADRLQVLSPAQFAALPAATPTGTPAGLSAGGPADIVIANILAGPLVELAPTLTRLTAPGGLLALSGLLAPQAAGVARVYQDAFALEPTEIDEDWALIHGRRLSVAG